MRAVNDKTAKDMLGEQFRRQLLMDGQFGSLAFVATHSDVLNRSEARRAFPSLPADATLSQCAAARNTYTCARLRRDFGEGLRELAEAAGDEITPAELAARSVPQPRDRTRPRARLARRSCARPARPWPQPQPQPCPSPSARPAPQSLPCPAEPARLHRELG